MGRDLCFICFFQEFFYNSRPIGTLLRWEYSHLDNIVRSLEDKRRVQTKIQRPPPKNRAFFRNQPRISFDH
jgi:hypothetical protein